MWVKSGYNCRPISHKSRHISPYVAKLSSRHHSIVHKQSSLSPQSKLNFQRPITNTAISLHVKNSHRIKRISKAGPSKMSYWIEGSKIFERNNSTQKAKPEIKTKVELKSHNRVNIKLPASMQISFDSSCESGKKSPTKNQNINFEFKP